MNGKFRAAAPPTLLIAIGLVVWVGTVGCGLFNRDPKPKPADESIRRADVMRADQEMRDSAAALLQESQDD